MLSRASIRLCSSGKTAASAGLPFLQVSAAGFAAIALIGIKRKVEEKTGNEYGLIALLSGRFGLPREQPTEAQE